MPAKTTLHVAVATLIAATPAFAEPLVIYSPQGGDRSVWIAEQAEAAGHDVEIINAGGGELFDRLLAEKNNPQADVVFGLVDASMAQLKSEDMFLAYTPSWAEGLPAQYIGADGQLHKFWQTPIVLGYNADKIDAADAPSSWLDLTQPEYKDRFVIGKMTSQTTRTYLAGMLARFADENGEVSDEGWAFMDALFDNAIVVNDWADKTAAFTSGEAVIDLNWFGGAFRQANEVGYDLKLVDTEGGTPFIAEGIAILNGTDQLDDAEAFVDWFGSPEFMAAYAVEFGQVPVHPEAVALSPESVQQDAQLVSPQDLDWEQVAPKLDGWLQRIELEIR